VFLKTLVAGSLTALVLAGCASTPGKKPLTEQERAELLLNVGNGSLMEGDPTGALQALLQSEAISPKMPEVHNSLALAYFAKKDYQLALKEAQTAVHLAPDYSDANNTLGKMYVDMGRYDQGLPYLLKAANNPLYRDAYKSLTNLGILFYRKGDFAHAATYFSKAIDANRDGSCVAHYYRGHLSLRAGDYADAIRNYQEATKKFCGGFADAHLAVGIVYEREKQYELARKTFLDVETRFPDSKVADEATQYLKGLP